MKILTLRPLCVALAAALCASPLRVADAAPEPAGNADALSQWGRLTGTPPPELVQGPDGDTRLVWSASATTDLYARDASGGELLTPYATGSFYAIHANTDSRQIADDSASWLQIDVTSSDDPALLPSVWQLNTLQAGRSGPGYQVALGDVPVTYSTLGTNTALRGVTGQKVFGSAALSATAGFISDSWLGLFDRNQRTQMLRDGLAVKAENSLTPAASVFATLQSYNDEGGSLPQSFSGVLPAAGRSGTAGLSFTHGRFTLQTEAAVSQFREQGGDWRQSGAGLADATWQWERATLRSGYHDIGRRFASLSSAAIPGMREAYINGSWTASTWATLTADLRTSRNRNATMQPPASIPPETQLQNPLLAPIPEKIDSATLQASLTAPWLPGLNALVESSVSHGSNADATRNAGEDYGVNLTYQHAGWIWGGGYQHARIFSGAIADSNGRSRTWSASATRSWTDRAGVLTLNATLAATMQRQDLDAGGRYRLDTATLSADLQHARWGQLSASYTQGLGSDALSNRLRQSAARIEAQHPLGKRGAIKLYAALSDNSSGLPAVSYREQLAGIQLGYTLGGDGR